MRDFERPDTPAQTYAALAGMFLLALGVLSLVLTEVGFGTVGAAATQPEFLIWAVSGWTAVFWIAMGTLGLLAAARLATAQIYALGAAVLFAATALWGFVDGNDVAGLLVADTTNNLTHAVLAAVGLICGLVPRESQRPADDRAHERRFERETSPGARMPSGRR